MFCPNCGAKGKEENQTYCQNCGTFLDEPKEKKVKSYVEAPVEKVNKSNKVYYPSAVSSTSRPTYASTSSSTSYYDDDYKKDYDKGGSKPHSFKCLAFGLLSIVLPIIAMGVGSSVLMSSLFSYSYYYGSRPSTSPAIMIIVIIMNVVGIIFGILGRVQNNKSYTEPENGAVKIGAVISVFGIIINCIAIVAAIAMLPLISGSYFSPYDYLY